MIHLAFVPELQKGPLAVVCGVCPRNRERVYPWTAVEAALAVVHLVEDHDLPLELAMNAIKEAADRRGWPL